MFLRIIPILCFFYLLPLTVEAQSGDFPFVAEVTSDNVNVRAGQSANFEKICRLKKGDEVIVVDKSYSWYKIKLPKTANSFISDKYVKIINMAKGEVTANRVNIRASTNVDASSLGQVLLGTQIHIIEKLPGWYKIEPLEESFGWLAQDFVSFKSKDISSYVATQRGKQEVAVSSLPTPSVQEQKIEKLEVVSVTGYLEPSKDSTSPEISYQLIIDGHPAYYIQGLKDFLDKWGYYKVKIEGFVKKDDQNQTMHPLLTISRIQLVL